MRRRRDKLRAAGLRPLQIWVPDTRAAGFAEECARQARLIREAETPESLAKPTRNPEDLRGVCAGIEDEAWFDASDKAGWTA